MGVGRARWRGLCTLAWVWSVAACEPPSSASPPVLLPVDSVVLAETEDVFVGTPMGFALTPEGSYLVSEARSLIHVFDVEGRHQRSMGGVGVGPGQLRAPPSAMTVSGDTLFALAGDAIELFDHRSGDFLSRKQVPARFSHALAVLGDQIYFRYVDFRERSTVGAIALASDSVRPGGPFPEKMALNPIIALTFSEIAVHPLGPPDTIAVAVRSADRIYVGPFDGPYDSFEVAVRDRLGSLPALMDTLAANPEMTMTDQRLSSLPMSLQRLSSGMFAYVTMDMYQVDGRLKGDLHVSVVDPAGGKSCPDARVPVSSDPPPLVAFRGDTLHVLFRDVERPNPSPWVTRYVLDVSGCRWVDG